MHHAKEHGIEFLFELLLQLALEVFEQLVFEFGVTPGWESLKHATRLERDATPLLAGKRGEDRPILFTFRAGALFAFGMALVRFLCVSA